MTNEKYFGAGETKTGLIVAYDYDEGFIRVALPCHPKYEPLQPNDNQLICPNCTRYVEGTIIRELTNEWATKWNVGMRKDWEPPLESLVKDWASAMLGIEPERMTVTVL